MRTEQAATTGRKTGLGIASQCSRIGQKISGDTRTSATATSSRGSRAATISPRGRAGRSTLPPVSVAKLRAIAGHGTKFSILEKSPPLDARAVNKQRPRGDRIAQHDAMKIAATQHIETPGPNKSRAGLVHGGVDAADLVIASTKDQADRPAPRMIMQSAVRVGVDEPVKIGTPAEGTKQVVAFEVWLALLAVDETAGQAPGNSEEEFFDHGREQSRGLCERLQLHPGAGSTDEPAGGSVQHSDNGALMRRGEAGSGSRRRARRPSVLNDAESECIAAFWRRRPDPSRHLTASRAIRSPEVTALTVDSPAVNTRGH